MSKRKLKSVATMAAACLLLYLSVGHHDDAVIHTGAEVDRIAVLDTEDNEQFLAIMPASERAYIKLIEESRHRYTEAGDDPVKMAAARDIIRSISQVIPAISAEEWLGTLKESARTEDGNAYLQIEIANNIVISTAQKSVPGDFKNLTLVKYGSQLSNQLAAMSSGARVKFSAKLTELDQDAHLTKPVLIARFRDVSLLD